MSGFRDFRDIVAWQLAHELKLRVDLFLLSPDFRRHYKFSDQLSDAVRSAPRNIAEGFARFRHKEFAQFVRVAKGSEAEVLNHLIDACDQRLITTDELQITEHVTKRALKAANGLIRYLESTPDVAPPPYKKRDRTPP
jgi:four helix bundle protein